MIIHIEICDVCRRINRGGIPVTTLATGTAISNSWDVCPGCHEKPFRVVKHSNAIRNHLLARIEALIVTELALMKDPV
jgi:hypothetical protein